MLTMLKTTRRWEAVPIMFAAAIMVVTCLPGLASAKTTLKMASLAPPGSRWAKAIKAAGKEIEEKTDGEVRFKLYAGGVMGDESAMVRKMRTGQIDGGAITSIGLGEIDPNMLMLQLPLLFKSHKQLDYVRSKMAPDFNSLMESKGFIILSWGDVGFTYLFTNDPVAVPTDVKSTKMWVWDTDPVSKEVMKVAGVNATPLGVPDVLPSLSTNVINGFLNSPYGAIALQWHKHAKYITDLKLATTVGAIVISKKSFNKLKPEHQLVVREVSKKYEASLLKAIRADNRASQRALVKKHGYTAVKAKDFPKWKSLADEVRRNLTGKVFKKALVDKMMGHLKNAP